MTDQKKQSILSTTYSLREWFKKNAVTLGAFGAISWQISVKGGGYIITKVSNVVDTANVAAQRSLLVKDAFEQHLAEAKEKREKRDNHERDQDTRLTAIETDIIRIKASIGDD